MEVTRRRFVRDAGAVTLGFLGVKALLSDSAQAQTLPNASVGYGPLVRDPDRLLDLPEGFSYKVISRAGESMADGLRVPNKFDGMCALPGPDGVTILIRNHEVTHEDNANGAFGSRRELLDKVDPQMFYDAGRGTRPQPSMGGTTTLVYDTTQKELVTQFLSLAGTIRNCAGGPTPWNSWVTCEETVDRAGSSRNVDHGYNFEVPATTTPTLANPVPLKAMGRFNHEAIAVDPKSGIVYETEDRDDGLFYRFIPEIPGQLSAGGKLQALKVKDKPKLDTRNWTTRPTVLPGEILEVEWIDMDDVESPSDNLRSRGFNAGAARFARGEGMWYGLDAIYFACTTGGRTRFGQVWRYVPSPLEGTPGEAEQPGRLELFVESTSSRLMKNADNLTITPWGDVIICEDHTDGQVPHLVGITPVGQYYRLARNSRSSSELAGATFSPDGSTLFVNVYDPGVTFAITGPWHVSEGDLVRDGKIDHQDIRAALEKSVGLRETTAEDLQVADFDKNGQIDVIDAVQILRNAFGFYNPS